MMLITQATVTVVTIYFFYRVLTAPDREEPDSYSDNDQEWLDGIDNTFNGSGREFFPPFFLLAMQAAKARWFSHGSIGPLIAAWL